MKRLPAILALILLATALTACIFGETEPPLYTVRTTTPETPSSTSLHPCTEITDPPDQTTDPANSETPPSAVETTTAPTTDAPPSPFGSIVVSAQPVAVKEGETYTGKAPLPALTLTVNDPDNKAGLDETRVDYSFGVAKDGKPNQVSVNHQAYFDEHDRAALTLDNISTEKVLYLTFDNGYEYNDLTGDILDTLKEKNVPATFFCTLDYIEDNPDYVVRMISEGHIVGNHSTTHPVMTDLTREKMAQEILGVENYLRVNFGYSSKYFRFPSGTYNDMALELVGSIGYRSIFWSNAHADWDTAAQPSVQKTFDTITSRLHPGSVILLHAVSQSNADALADIIDYARAEGYLFRSLDEYPGW